MDLFNYGCGALYLKKDTINNTVIEVEKSNCIAVKFLRIFYFLVLLFTSLKIVDMCRVNLFTFAC